MIPVYQPWLTDIERKYLLEAFDTGWVSSTGSFINAIESEFESFIGVRRAHVASSGTTALHLALRAIGIKAGDKIAMPCMTFAATAFAASYCDAELVFIDTDPATWNMDLTKLGRTCAELKARGEKLAAVIVVHLFGSPVDMNEVSRLSTEYGFSVVEDACESFGSSFDGKMTGAIGDIGVFSFYGNKTITSGEGGVVTTNNLDYGDKVHLLRGQAVDPKKRYWHIDVGHNYRMTNMQAAILLGQMRRFEEIKAAKLRVYQTYRDELGDLVEFQQFHEKADVLPWIIAIKTPVKFAVLNAFLADRQIDSRPFFYAMQSMPVYSKYSMYSHEETDKIVSYGIMLPSYPQLTNDDIKQVCDTIKRCINAS